MTDELHDEEVSPEQPTDPTEDVEETSEETSVSSEERASSDAAPRASNLKQRIALAVMLVFAVGLGFLIGRNSDPDAGDASEHAHAHGEGGDASAEETWTCSMHPQIRAKEPGSCPICGMDLIPATSNDTGPPLTSSQVRLSERARTLAKIQTEAVTTTSQDRSTRQLFGQVVENEGA